MADQTTTTLYEVSDKISKLVAEKKAARDFQLRKHADWDENYELARNKVKTNRLTQRQAVNIPLMKETIKTLISTGDDCPTTEWLEKSGDQMKEIIFQEIWEEMFKRNKLEQMDILDKKNVFLYGLSTKFLNLGKKGVDIHVLDVYDVVYDPNTDPLDIETARYIVRQNIFKPLRDILVDKRYTQSGKDKLKDWLASERGLIQSGKNKEEWEKKMARLRAMGTNSQDFAMYAGGDVLVNLTEQYTNIWNPDTKKFERRVVTYADDCIELLDDSLYNLIGVYFWPFTFWSEDPETNDIYPDSIGDIIRTPNKIINAWFSQQVENRTLQNFTMHWYDSSIEGYVPQTYDPGPGRMLPAPGDPSKTIKAVEINGLDETMDAINFVTQLVERATGATSIEKGEPDSGVQTLGEIKILVGKAGARANTMAKFHRGSWYDLAKKWEAMMQANSFGSFTLYKTGQDGKVYPKKVYDKDWKSDAGYEPSITSTAEQESEQIKNIQKFGFVMQQFPNNFALRKIMQKRELKILKLTPAELKEVQDAEEQIQQQALADQANKGNPEQPTQDQPQPTQTQPDPNAPSGGGQDLSAEIGQLGALMGGGQ